jgi:hypothetical protein
MVEQEGTLHVVKATPVGYEELAVADVAAGTYKPRVFPTSPVFYDRRIDASM